MKNLGEVILACPLCPGSSDVNLFGNRECVINLNAEISNRAHCFCVTRQKLNRAEIARSPIDEGCLGLSERMRTEEARV